MPKLRATITAEYEVTDQQMHENYGTTNPKEAARIDCEQFDQDPGLILHMDTDVKVNVEVIDE